jgi:Flp pilus assembly protein TadG
MKKPQMIKTIKKERGQTLAEFALALPVLLVLLLGVFQFGVAFNNYVTLTDAVRAGARKAAVSRQESDPVGTCRAQVLGAADNLDQSVLAPTITCVSSWKSGDDVTVHADYPFNISLLGWVVVSGRLNSTIKERVE